MESEQKNDNPKERKSRRQKCYCMTCDVFMGIMSEDDDGFSFWCDVCKEDLPD